MAQNTTISNAAAIVMMNALTALYDAGSGQGKIRIYDGAQPVNPDVAVSAQTLLAELPLSDPAFATAIDANPGGQATANSITSEASALDTGTATWFRALDSDNVAVSDGTVGVSGSDLNLNSVAISAGSTVGITSWALTQRETA